ncbi:YbdD/YjiX family protein [Gordonia insulae]|uniref:YbdD/YjiX family protein n=1 Tax=Gordonia insulae TaxID=2420509 RepID=A0A3G8JUZ6_9ACTN|nr:YbdD/YjiX family protein [Gordonia insulae]AZG48698.1 hypothetical protein D7316_05319 [Gordonia insulae]
MIETLRRGAAAVSWYVGSVMGDRDYRRYVDHTARIHPGEPVLSEREYWRRRYAEQDRNPGARCC